MPQVPSYGGPKVQQEGLPGARLEVAGGAEAFGGGSPQARVSEAAMNLFESEKKKADQLAVLEADTKTVQEKTRLFYDPKDGAVNVRGKDALGITKPYMENFSKFTSEVEAKLSPAQAAAYKRLSSGHAADLNSQLQSHASSEYRAFDDASTMAGVAAAKAEATVDPFNIPKVSFQIEKQKAIIDDHAERNGTTGEIADRRKAAAESDTHLSIINQMAESNKADLALDYFDGVSDKMLTEDRRAAQEKIDRKLPQDLAGAIYAGIKAKDKAYNVGGKSIFSPDGSVDLTQVEELVEKKTNGKLSTEQRQNAVKYVDAYFNQDMLALKKSNAGVSQAAYSQIDTLALKGASLDDQRRVADKLVEKLPDGQPDAHDLRTKYKYIEQMARSDQGQDDPQTVIALSQGILDGSITNASVIMDELANGNLRKKTATNMVLKLGSDASPAMKQQYDQIKASVDADISVPAEREKFMATLHAQALEKRITDPVELQKLYKAQAETVPTGAPGFFSFHGYGTKEEASYAKVQAQIHENRDFVRAMGGGEAAFKLAQKMGGPSNFQADSDYSKAVIALVKRGVDPKRIIPQSVHDALKNHPEWFK